MSLIGISQIGGIEADVCKPGTSKRLCESKHRQHPRDHRPLSSLSLRTVHTSAFRFGENFFDSIRFAPENYFD